MRKILFDNNMLSSAFNGKQGDATDRKRREKVRELLSDAEVRPVITPLVRFELLCGMCHTSANELNELENALAAFDEVLVREKEAIRAAELFCLYKDNYQIKGQEMNRHKRAFDFLYCACAEVNNLETVSDDRHIENIQKLMQEHPTTVSRQP